MQALHIPSFNTVKVTLEHGKVKKLLKESFPSKINFMKHNLTFAKISASVILINGENTLVILALALSNGIV